MTPLIDVTFLLIVFFMLVNNIVASEAAPLVPPTLDNSIARGLGEQERVVVSIVPVAFAPADRSPDPLNHPGTPDHVRVGAQRFSLDTRDLSRLTELLQARLAEQPETSVLLRADAAAYYESVQPVLSAVTAAGIGRVHLVAQMPDGPGPGQGG